MMASRKNNAKGRRPYKPNPPEETRSAVDKPVKIHADFDTAMGALLQIPGKKKSKRKKRQ